MPGAAPQSGAAVAVALVALLFALGLAVAALGFNRLRLKPRAREQNAPFEQGRPAQGKTWVQFRPRYALLALLFVAFDMEMVFMFPWAVAFRSKGMVAFLDMLVFIAILGSAIAFAWKEGAFDWEG